MTSNEYVIWLKGFVEACHEYAPTPKQWDALKDKLKEVDDKNTSYNYILNENDLKVNTTISPKINPPYTTGGNDDIKEI